MTRKRSSVIPQPHRPLYLWLPVVFLLAALLMGSYINRAAFAAEASIKAEPDEYLYFSGDTASFHITIDPGSAGLTGDVLLEVYDAGSVAGPDGFTGDPVFDTTIEAGGDYRESESFDYSLDTSDLGLGPGGYPVKVSVYEDGNEVVSDVTWLPIADEESGNQVDLLMIWAVGSPPERNADGEFVNSDILARCTDDPMSDDSLLQHLEIAKSHPDIKTVYAIEPSLLEQLGDLADGFTLREGDDVKEFPDTSIEADSASKALDSLSGLAASENVEVLSSPYETVQLPMLAREGWSDGDGQYRIGDDILTKSLSMDAEPAGAYAPGLQVTTDSLKYLAATGGEYAVLGGSLRQYVEGNITDDMVSFRLRDLSGERITSFFADDTASESLMGNDPDPSGFFAALINLQQKEEGPKLLIAASPVPMPALSADQREKVYSLIDEEPWINSITLNEAKEKYRPDTEPVTLLYYTDPVTGYVSQTYYNRLASVHDLYQDYRDSVDTHEPGLLELDRLLFTAESEYWAGNTAKPEDANRGLVYLDKVQERIDEEFGMLKLNIATPWLQRSSDSNATISVTNSSTHPFTLTLAVESDNAELTQGYDQTIRAEPGKTEVEVPYRSNGWAGISATISSGGTVIADSSSGIRPVTSRVWIVIFVALAALLIGVVYYVLVVRRGIFR